MKNKFFLLISIVLLIASIVCACIFGFTRSVDSKYSTLITVTFIVPVENKTVAKALEKDGVKSYSIQPMTDSNGKEGVAIRLQLPKGKTGNDVLSALNEKINFYSSSVTGIGQTIVKSDFFTAAWTLAVAALLTLAYVFFRYGRKAVLIAVAGTVHNAVIALGVMTAAHIGITTATIGAYLFIFGITLTTLLPLFAALKENAKKLTGKEEIFAAARKQALPVILPIAIAAVLFAAGALFLQSGTMMGFGILALVGAAMNLYATTLVLPSFWGMFK